MIFEKLPNVEPADCTTHLITTCHYHHPSHHHVSLPTTHLITTCHYHTPISSPRVITTTHLITTCHYYHHTLSHRVNSGHSVNTGHPFTTCGSLYLCVTVCNTYHPSYHTSPSKLPHVTLQVTTRHPPSYHMSPCASLTTRHTFHPKAYTLRLPTHRISQSPVAPVTQSQPLVITCQLSSVTSSAPRQQCHPPSPDVATPQ